MRDPFDSGDGWVSNFGNYKNIGLIDIPHCTAPIDVNELAAHTIEMSLPEILPAPVIFIPGVKNQGEHSSLESLEEMDFMRGEETQVFGAIELYGIEAPATFMFLSSHTKVIDVDEKYRITRSFTMLSGQIFNALRFHSFLASSIPKENPTCIHIRLSINEKVNLSLALEEFFGCNRVDLVILDEADPFLAAEVIRGERLFARDEYEADEYDLYILRRAGDLAPLERERMALILGEET